MVLTKERLQESVLLTLIISFPIISFNAIGTSMQIPMIDTLKNSYSLNDFETQYIFTIFSVCVGLGQLIFGVISDTYGRKKVILNGVLITAVSTMAMSYANSYSTLMFFRALEGVGTSMTVIGGFSMYRDLHVGYALGKLYALAIGWTSLLYFATSMTVSKLLKVLDDYTTIFSILSIMAFFSYIFIYLFVAETNENVNNRKMPTIKYVFIGYYQILKSKNFITYILLNSNGSGVFALYTATLPITFKSLGLDTDNISYYYGITPLAYVTASLIISKYIAKIGFRKIILISIVIHLIAAVLAYILRDDNSIASSVIPMMLAECATACVLSYVPAIALEKMKSVAGAASSLLNASNYIIAGASTFILTSIFEDNFKNAFVTSFYIYAVILTVGGLIVYKDLDGRAGGEEHIYDESLEK